MEEMSLHDQTEADEILGEGDGSASPIMLHMEQQLLPAEATNFGFRMLSYQQEEVKGYNKIGDFPEYSPAKWLSIRS